MIDSVNDLDKESLLSDDLYEELYQIKDGIERTNKKNEILMKAKEFRITKYVEDKMKMWVAELRRRSAEQQKMRLFHKVTNFFDDGTNNPKPDEYFDLDCGTWIADENGIYSSDSEKLGQVACRHPIFPLKVLKNLETGEEQITLAYKIRGTWFEHTVPRVMVSKANSIIELARYGVSVNSENAKYLVSYLSDVQDFNEDLIKLKESTSKLGWTIKGNLFIPYDKEVEFDGETRFLQLFGSVSEAGSFDSWLDIAKSVRANKAIEPRIALAASFASTLIKPLGILPFIVDEYGETEGGKTVCLMLATSVWADPGESRYMGDFKTTDVALEIRCDLLNSLPLILDDTSKATAKIRENFESIVYDLCSGKGKSRSNKELGANRECNWQNITICNGERPLSGYVEQGGAINRILEVRCGDTIFSNPRKVAETVKLNYGFAGRLFVEHIKEMDPRAIKKLHKHYEEELTNQETMQKQVSALACILTADAIATDCIFNDGHALSSDEVADILIDRNRVSEGARCYEFILDELEIHEQYFLGTIARGNFNGDVWGEIKESEGIVNFIPQAFHNLLKNNGFYPDQFFPWARNRGLIETDNDKKRNTKTVRMYGEKIAKKVICLKIDRSFAENFDSEIEFE